MDFRDMDKLQRYYTPDWVALKTAEMFNKYYDGKSLIYDPCYGDGNLEKYINHKVIGTDIENGDDFLRRTEKYPDGSWIICNPPYTKESDKITPSIFGVRKHRVCIWRNFIKQAILLNPNGYNLFLIPTKPINLYGNMIDWEILEETSYGKAKVFTSLILFHKSGDMYQDLFGLNPKKGTSLKYLHEKTMGSIKEGGKIKVMIDDSEIDRLNKIIKSYGNKFPRLFSLSTLMNKYGMVVK